MLTRLRSRAAKPIECAWLLEVLGECLQRTYARAPPGRLARQLVIRYNKLDTDSPTLAAARYIGVRYLTAVSLSPTIFTNCLFQNS